MVDIRKRTKSEHEKVNKSKETCIMCFEPGKSLLEGTTLEGTIETGLIEKKVGEAYFCFKCGHVWLVYDTREIEEVIGQSTREYFWKKIGKKQPS